MKKSNFKIVLTMLLTVIFAVGTLTALPPEGGPKAKEKIMQYKKIKLLDILQLDEPTSEKFLAKYSVIERKIDEKKKNLDRLLDELDEELRKGTAQDNLSAKTTKILELQSELANELIESAKSMKSILNETQYAKYVVFESKFREELQRMIMKRMKGKDGKGRNNRDDE